MSEMRKSMTQVTFFAFAIMVSFPALVAAELSTLNNGIFTIGVDTAYGGAITYLVDKNVPSVNLINTHDFGRVVQQSWYSGPVPYDNAVYDGQPWPWNPIGCGDIHRNPGTILNLTNDGTQIYVKSRPLQWALNNVPCECYMETWIKQDAQGAFVRNRLTTFRADTTAYPARGQEMPAVYVIGSLQQVLWLYDGSAPWTNQPLSAPSAPQGSSSAFTSTESWVMWSYNTPPGYYGLGIMNTGTQTFGVGHFGPATGGANDDPTGYLSPWKALTVPGNGTIDFCYYIGIGYRDDLRNYFSARRGYQC